MPDKSYLTIEERLQKLESNKYDVLYDKKISIAQTGTSVNVDIRNLSKYREICVQLVNAFSREILVRIPCWDFNTENLHYHVNTSVDGANFDILRVSPFWTDKYFYFAYEKYLRGISLKKIVGVY